MRLAFISQNGCEADAIGSQLVAKALAAQSAGFEVRIFLSEGQRLREELRPRAVVASPHELWRNRQQREYLLSADAVLVEFGGDYPLLDLLPVLARRQQRLIFIYHGLTPTELWPPSARGRVQAAENRRRWAAFADEIWATSDFTTMELHHATGIPLHRIRKLPCVLWDRPAVELADPFREPTRLLFVGRMAPNKDVPTLLRAFAKLHLDYPDLHLELIGADHDLYATEASRSRSLVGQLGIQSKVHFRGMVPDDQLQAAFGRAAALVLPSRHEGFGMPLLEAMAAGVPIVCSDAGALPETAGSAALCFRAGDPSDLARRLRQVLAHSNLPTKALPSLGRVALVSPRFGSGIVGGAERSLATMGLALRGQGLQVEVFTTCTEAASHWTNTLPAGTEMVDNLLIHRFPIDPHDPRRLAEACERVAAEREQVPDSAARQYLEHSLGSTRLVEELKKRQEEFDAILVGPYLFRLTWQVASSFPDRTLLVPCFHNEPYAFLPCLRSCFRQVAGYLYHTATEQRFAEKRLGMNHPRSWVVGTLLQPVAPSMHAQLPQALASKAGDYLVYCGRFCAEKGLEELLEWGDMVAARDPLFHLALVGAGPMPLPRRTWLTNLGFVSEATKQAVVGNALALVSLSRNESLSIVLLEAWNQAVPVIGHSECEVVQDQIHASRGGLLVRSADELLEAVQGLRNDSEFRRQLGENGRCFTSEHYQDAAAYARILVSAVNSLKRPLVELLLEAGRQRCQSFASTEWRRQFHELLLRDSANAPRHEALQVELLQPTVRYALEQQRVLLAVRLRNVGAFPISSTGIQPRFLWTSVLDEQGEATAEPIKSAIPDLLAPGEQTPATLRLRLPMRPGDFGLAFALGSRKRPGKMSRLPMQIHVGTNVASTDALAPALAAVQKALAAAEAQSRLPLDYTDVTSGWFAGLKRWFKQKLLHNFRRAYIEPLARQQTQVNRQILTALAHLAEAVQLREQVSAHETAENRENQENPQGSGVRRARMKEPRLRRDSAHGRITRMTQHGAEQEAPT